MNLELLLPSIGHSIHITKAVDASLGLYFSRLTLTDPFINFNSGHFTVNQNITCSLAPRFSHWYIDNLS